MYDMRVESRQMGLYCYIAPKSCVPDDFNLSHPYLVSSIRWEFSRDLWHQHLRDPPSSCFGT